MTNRKQKRAPAPKLKQPPANERPAKHRPTAAEKAGRVNTVETMLLSGARRVEILQFAANQWGLEDRQADTYIAEANAIILAEANKQREQLFAEQTGRLDYVLKLALGGADLTNANKAVAEKNKLCGLYPPSKQEISGPGGGPIPTAGTLDLSGMSDAELDQFIANIEAATRLGALGKIPPDDGAGPTGVDAPAQADADAGSSV